MGILLRDSSGVLLLLGGIGGVAFHALALTTTLRRTAARTLYAAYETRITHMHTAQHAPERNPVHTTKTHTQRHTPEHNYTHSLEGLRAG